MDDLTMDEREKYARHYAHYAAALTEGLCPVDSGPIEPEPQLPGIGGYCRKCGAWRYYEPDRQAISMDVAFNPLTGEPFRHRWMADAGALPDHGRPRRHLPGSPAHRPPLGSAGSVAAHHRQAGQVQPRRRAGQLRTAAPRAHRTPPRQQVRKRAVRA